MVVAAVFLSYNANKGLPFTPTYTLEAQLPSASNLAVGNEVLIGGARVGTVEAIEAERQRRRLEHRPRRPEARAVGAPPLPKRLHVPLRPRSALGLKYVEITRGT